MNVRERLTVRSAVSACRSCELCKVAKQPIPFKGNSDAKVVILGEAPGRYEDAAGEVFVGPSGQLLDELLSRANMDMELAFLNTVSCFPNRTPTEREVKICAGNVDRQLQHIQPSIIVALGGVAVSRWWQDIRVGDIRGKWWLGREQDNFAWITATWHPAAILRNSSLADDCIADLRRVRRLLITNLRDPLSPDRGAMGYPFNSTCVVCGSVGDVWLDCDGKVSDDGRGALAWCQKHYERRVGLGGTGRTVAKNKGKKAEVKSLDQGEMF